MTSDALRVAVARQMLRDELRLVPQRFDEVWAEEEPAWLRNATSALAAVAEFLRSGPWDAETRAYGEAFAAMIGGEA